MKKVRVGVIGCGYIAQSVHIPNYQKSPLATLVAVADLDNKKLKVVHERYLVEKHYTDYHDLLATKGA